MLRCRDITELVTDYLEGRLSLAQWLSFQLHVGMCRDCREYLRQMKLTIRALGRLPDEPIPTDIRQALLSRFRTMRRISDPPVARFARRAHALIETIVGGRRGWVLVGCIVIVAILVAALGGAPGVVQSDWPLCLAMELGTAVVPLAAIGALAFKAQVQPSPATCASVAGLGAFLGFLALEVVCPASHVAAHVLTIHVGALLLAIGLGLGAWRLLLLR